MSRFQSSGLRLRSRLSAVALVASLGGSALALLPLAAPAQPVGEPGRSRPTPEQLEKIFPEFRTLQLQDRRSRIATMQTAERCIQGAKNATALQSCMKQERTTTMTQRQQHYSALRQLFESNGLPVPEMGRGDRRNRKLNPGGAGSQGGSLPL